jgi:hypothetical protein
MSLKILILKGLALAFLCTSCQYKGMYVAKGSNVPMPINLSFMKKSARDTQDAEGPGYKYHSETIDGDETIVPSAIASAYKWGLVTKHLAGGFNSYSSNKAATDQVNSNNTAAIQQAKIAADAQAAKDAAALAAQKAAAGQ